MISNIAILFGGRSCEHEISILSAIQVMNALKDKYHVIPLYISKEGELFHHPSLMDIEVFKQGFKMKRSWLSVLVRKKTEVYVKAFRSFSKKERIDFVFPIMHGQHGEDGCIQGYLEMLNIPYASCDVLASATCMSKIRSKQLLQYFSIPTLDFYVVDENHKQCLWTPCIIKPDKLGSSIGIQIVHHENEWQEKLETALLYDQCCLVEPYIAQFEEINCSVRRSNGEIILSDLELVNKKAEILSFHDKYEQEVSTKTNHDRIIAPDIEEEIAQKIKQMAAKVYECFHLSGVIRIDFMLIDHEVYVNEINTIPGSYAFYLWNMDFLTLLESEMKEALFAYQKKECKIVSFESDVLFHFHGSKHK